MRKFWSLIEIDLLKDLYINKGFCASEISKIMNRTLNSIKIKIVRFKLKHTKEQTKIIKSRLNTGIGNGMYGKSGPNKGLTKENSLRIKNAGLKISNLRIKMFQNGLGPDNSGSKNGMYGKIPWSKGLTKHNDVRLQSNSIKNSDSKKILWKSYSEEEKEKRRIRWGKAGLRCNKKDTSIEIKVRNYFQEIGVHYIPQYQIGRFRADFYIPSVNLVIECQGDYWHVNPKKYNTNNLDGMSSAQKSNLKRDIKKKNYLKDNNIDSLFLWEYDINYNFDNVMEKIREKCFFAGLYEDVLYFCS